MTRKKVKALVIYGYAIEIVLAGLLILLLWQFGWFSSVGDFVEASAASWATLFGVMLAGAMAARLVFFSLNSSDFSAWLEWKKVGGVISGVFLFNLIMFLVAAGTNVVLVYVKGTWLTMFGVFIGLLGLINSVTFSVFVFQLSRLQARFNYEFKRAKGDGK